jgi:hypothetical protein
MTRRAKVVALALAGLAAARAAWAAFRRWHPPTQHVSESTLADLSRRSEEQPRNVKDPHPFAVDKTRLVRGGRRPDMDAMRRSGW